MLVSMIAWIQMGTDLDSGCLQCHAIGFNTLTCDVRWVR